MSLPAKMVLVGLWLCLLGVFAPAGAEAKESYMIKWRSIPRDADQLKKWRPDWEMIVSVNIRPETLVTLDRDYSDGKKYGFSLTNSSELALLTSNRVAACALMVKDMMKGYDVLVPCFVDDDRDGKFEKYFLIGVKSGAMIPFYGSFPDDKTKYQNIDPIPYTISREPKPGNYPVAFLKIDDVRSALSPHFFFDVCFASGSRANFLPGYAVCGINPISIMRPSEGHPRELEFFGGKLVIDKAKGEKSNELDLKVGKSAGGVSVIETESFKEIAIP